MKREALYHADTNELEELPSIEEPTVEQCWNEAVNDRERGPYYLVRYDRKMKAYRDHLASLRRLPCSPQPGFKDGEKYVENEHYEVRPVCNYTGSTEHSDCLMHPSCDSCTMVAFPLVPVKSEDETKLWDSAIDLYHRHMHTGHVNAIAELKSKYIITKR